MSAERSVVRGVAPWSREWQRRGVGDARDERRELVGLAEERRPQVAPCRLIDRTAHVQVDPIGPGVRCHCNCDAALLDIIGGNLNSKQWLVGRTPQACLLDAIATVEIASDDQKKTVRRQSSVI